MGTPLALYKNCINFYHEAISVKELNVGPVPLQYFLCLLGY